MVNHTILKQQVYMRYYANNIVLYVNSDTAYLVLLRAKSRIASYYYLFDHSNKTTHSFLNSTMLVEYKILG